MTGDGRTSPPPATSPADAADHLVFDGWPGAGRPIALRSGEGIMVNILDYATPTVRKASFGKLTWASLVCVVEHALVFGLYAATLDGGVCARKCLAVSAGFWLVVLIIAVRRRQNPTRLDLAFVAFGYPMLLSLCLYAVDGTL